MNKKLLNKLLFIFALSGSFCKADFFIYQRWVNKKTRQNVHEFFDIHLTKSGRANLIKQQNNFVEAVKQCNGLALLEDTYDTNVKLHGAEAVSIKSEEQSDKLKFMDNLYFNDSPLTCLMDFCRKSDVECVNIDIRNPLMPKVFQVIAATGMDAYAFSCIKKSKKNDIFLAAGARHIAAINCDVARDGFVLEETVIAEELLKILNAQNLTGNDLFVQQYLQVILNSYKTRSNPYDYTYADDTKTLNHVDCMMASNPIDIEIIMAKYMQKREEDSKANLENALSAQSLENHLKMISAVAGLASTGYLLYKKRFRHAAAAAILGIELFKRSETLANWMYPN